MRKKVGDDERRIILIVADIYVNDFAVLLNDNAVDGKRYAEPLILADAAVVVGFEVCDLVALHERHLLEVEARGVDVRGADVRAGLHRLSAHNRKNESLAAE